MNQRQQQNRLYRADQRGNGCVAAKTSCSKLSFSRMVMDTKVRALKIRLRTCPASRDCSNQKKQPYQKPNHIVRKNNIILQVFSLISVASRPPDVIS
jgi:hypothetical protein